MDISAPRCPICNTTLACPGPYMRDTLSYHFLRMECRPERYEQAELDLSGFYPVDYMAVWLTLLRIPSVRHLFLTVPSPSSRDSVMATLGMVLAGKKGNGPIQMSQALVKGILGGPGSSPQSAMELTPSDKERGSITTVEVKVPLREMLTRTNLVNQAERLSFALMARMGRNISTVESEKPVLRSEEQSYTLHDIHKEASIRIIQTDYTKPSMKDLVSIPFELVDSSTVIELLIKRKAGVPFDIIIPINLGECLRKHGIFLSRDEFDEEVRTKFIEGSSAQGKSSDTQCMSSVNGTQYNDSYNTSQNEKEVPPKGSIKTQHEDAPDNSSYNTSDKKKRNTSEVKTDDPHEECLSKDSYTSYGSTGEQVQQEQGFPYNNVKCIMHCTNNRSDDKEKEFSGQIDQHIFIADESLESNVQNQDGDTGHLVENEHDKEQMDVDESSKEYDNMKLSSLNEQEPIVSNLFNCVFTPGIKERGAKETIVSDNNRNRRDEKKLDLNGTNRQDALQTSSAIESDAYNFITLSTLEKTEHNASNVKEGLNRREGDIDSSIRDTYLNTTGHYTISSTHRVDTNAISSNTTKDKDIPSRYNLTTWMKSPLQSMYISRTQKLKDTLIDPRITKLKTDIEASIGKAYMRRNASFISRNEMRLMSSILMPSLESIDGRPFNQIEKVDGPKIVKRNYALGIPESMTIEQSPVKSETPDFSNPESNTVVLDKIRHMRGEKASYGTLAFSFYRIYGSKPAIFIREDTAMEKIKKKLKLGYENNMRQRYEEIIPQHFYNRAKTGRKYIKDYFMSKVLIPESYSLTRDSLPTPPILCRSLQGNANETRTSNTCVNTSKHIVGGGFSMQTELGLCTSLKVHPSLPYVAIGTTKGAALVSITETAPEYLSRKHIPSKQRFPWKIPVSLLLPDESHNSSVHSVYPTVTSLEFVPNMGSHYRYSFCSNGSNASSGIGDYNSISGQTLLTGDRAGRLTCLKISKMKVASLYSNDSDWDDPLEKMSEHKFLGEHSPLFDPITNTKNVGFKISSVTMMQTDFRPSGVFVDQTYPSSNPPSIPTVSSSTSSCLNHTIIVSGYSKNIMLYDLELNCISNTIKNAHALPHILTVVPNINEKNMWNSVISTLPNDDTYESGFKRGILQNFISDDPYHPITCNINHTFMSFGSDCMVKLWDIRASSQACAEIYVSRTPIVSAVSSSSSGLVGFATADAGVRILDANMFLYSRTIDLINIPNIPTKCIHDRTHLAFMNNGKFLAVGSSGSSSIKIFETSKGRIVREMCIACALPIRDLQLGGSGNPVCLGLSAGAHPYKLGILAGSYSANLEEPVDTDCICTDISIPKKFYV